MHFAVYQNSHFQDNSKSNSNAQAIEKDWTRLAAIILPLSHWSTPFLDLSAQLSLSSSRYLFLVCQLLTLQPQLAAQTHGAEVVKVTLALSTILWRASNSFTVNRTNNVSSSIVINYQSRRHLLRNLFHKKGRYYEHKNARSSLWFMPDDEVTLDFTWSIFKSYQNSVLHTSRMKSGEIGRAFMSNYDKRP